MKKIISLILVMLILVALITSCEIVEDIVSEIQNEIYGYDEVVASSDNFEVTRSMMNYFGNAYYQNWYSMNYYYILLGYVNFDPSLPLDEQYLNSNGTETYYDYFVNKTKEMVETYLGRCEAAIKDEYVNFDELEINAQKYADDMLFEIENSAKAMNVSLDTYLQQYFGEHVNEKNFRKSLIMENIATEYYDIVRDRIATGITAEEEYEFLKNNLSFFVKAEFIKVVLPLSESATIERLSRAKDIDEFNALMEEVGLDSQNKSQIAVYQTDTDFGKFLFAGVKEQFGVADSTEDEARTNAELYDVFIDENSKGYLTLYFVTVPAHIDETPLRNVGHILFMVDEKGEYKTSAEAKAAAEALFAEIQNKLVDGKISKELFDEFAQNTHDNDVFYENVNKGDMVEPFENWLFNATTEGEVGLVETTYGWHIMYYGGESGEIAWRMVARNGVVERNLQVYFDNVVCDIAFDDSVFKDIFK